MSSVLCCEIGGSQGGSSSSVRTGPGLDLVFASDHMSVLFDPPLSQGAQGGVGGGKGVQARLSHCAVENRQWVATAAPLGQAAGRPGASCALFGMPCGRFDTGVYQGVGVMRQVACRSGCLLCSGLHGKAAGSSHRRQGTEEVKRSAMVVVREVPCPFPVPSCHEPTNSVPAIKICRARRLNCCHGRQIRWNGCGLGRHGGWQKLLYQLPQSWLGQGGKVPPLR